MPEIILTSLVHPRAVSEITPTCSVISWNGREPKIDVRDWSPDHSKMSKGLTFTKEEMIELKNLVDKL